MVNRAIDKVLGLHVPTEEQAAGLRPVFNFYTRRYEHRPDPTNEEAWMYYPSGLLEARQAYHMAYHSGLKVMQCIQFAIAATIRARLINQANQSNPKGGQMNEQ